MNIEIDGFESQRLFQLKAIGWVRKYEVKLLNGAGECDLCFLNCECATLECVVRSVNRNNHH